MRRSIITLFATAILAGSGFACGDDDGSTTLDENIVVDNVTPMGTVGGQLLDAVTDLPLDGVEVTIVTGGFSAKGSTDSSGIFSIANVPATGVVIATFEKAGYLSADLVATFNGAAGNYAVDNATVTFGPVGLVPSDGEFTVYVYDENGRPAQGHILTLTTGVKFINYDAGWPMSSGSVTATAQVGSTGIATFFNIPDFWMFGEKLESMVAISVPPYDADGDGFYEFAGEVYQWDLLDLGNPQPTILLTDGAEYPTTLGVVASTVQQLETGTTTGYAPASIPGVGPIHVLFNQPIAESSLVVYVYDEEGRISYIPQTQLNGRSLTITFPTALPSGGEYNLNIIATALTGDQLQTGSFSGSFFVIDAATPVTATVTLDDPLDPANRVRHVEFSEPVGFGVASTALNGANCIIYYNFGNLGAGTDTGDDPGELGSATCPYAFTPEEPVPLLPAGAALSGYTKYWKFSVASIYNATIPPPPAVPVPAATDVHLIFGAVDSATRIMRRANGQPVETIVITLP